MVEERRGKYRTMLDCSSISVEPTLTMGAMAATTTEYMQEVTVAGLTVDMATVGTLVADSTAEQVDTDTDVGRCPLLLANTVFQRSIGLPRFARAAARR